jgi:uncharacterized protein (DUF488 family)
LPECLSEVGISYHHAPDLGGRRNKQQLPGGSPNTYWRNQSFRNYADYALTPNFGTAFATLCREATVETCSIMCAETAWQQCHRQIITDYVLAAGIEVIHIRGPKRFDEAVINEALVVQANGGLHYVSAQGTLL